MAGFMINTTEVYIVCSELEHIVKKLIRLESRLEDATPKAGISADILTGMRGNVGKYVSDVEGEKSRVGLLGVQLSGIAELYRSVENRVETELQPRLIYRQTK